MKSHKLIWIKFYSFFISNQNFGHFNQQSAHFLGFEPHLDRPQVVFVVFPITFSFGALHDPQGLLGLQEDFPQGEGGGGQELHAGVFCEFSHFGQPFVGHPQGMLARMSL